MRFVQRITGDLLGQEVMRKRCIFILMFCSALLWGQIPTGYYVNAEGKTGESLKTALHEIIHEHTRLSYDGVWSALKYTDEDPNNSNNVILLYTGWSYPKSNNGGGTTEWNREHTWAKSQGNFGTSAGAGTDIHHLRPTDVTVNSKRGSLMFDNGGSEYTDGSRYGGGDGATGCKVSSSNWEPRDEVKGDVARMLFYMATCYESEDGVDLELAEYSSTSGLHGKLSTLLEWDEQDPVSDWEVRRNNRAYEKQGNRNPFIDHPEYVCLIWGDGDCDTIVNPPDTTTKTLTGLDLTFDSDLDGCTMIQVSGSEEWVYSSDYTCAYINTHEQGANESWLVTPAVNMDTIDNEVFTFDVTSYNENKTIASCGSGQFELYYSTQFDGSTINATDWNRITSVDDVVLGDRWDFVTANVDVTGIQGDNVYYAFVHSCGSDDGTTWELDNIKLSGNIIDGLPSVKTTPLNIYPNPAKDAFHLSSSVDKLIIMSISGQVLNVYNDVKVQDEIDVSTFNSGIYLIKTLMNGDGQVQKLIIQ